MKILIVSKPNDYITKFKDLAYRNDIDVVSVCQSVDDLTKSVNLIQNSKVDKVICYDGPDTAISFGDVYRTLGKMSLENDIVLITDTPDTLSLAVYFRIFHISPSNISPDTLLMYLEILSKKDNPLYREQNQHSPDERYENDRPDEYDRKSQRGRDRSFKQSSRERKREMRNLNTPEQNTSSRYEEQNRMGAVHTELKPIMVCTASSKGGVGKTTTAIELASTLAARAKSITPEGRAKIRHPWEFRVCLVDFNPSFDTMSEIIKCTHDTPRNELPSLNDWFEEYEDRFVNVLPVEAQREYDDCQENGIVFPFADYIDDYASAVMFEEAVFEDLTVRDPETGLFVIPAIHDALDVASINPDLIGPILKLLNTYFDVVVVDTGNNISNFTINTIDTVDRSLIICEKSNGAAATVDKFLKTLDEIEVNSSRCSLVLSNAHSQGDDKLSTEYEHRFGMGIVADIPYDKSVIKSHENHEFYAVNNPKTEYAKTIVKLAHWIYPLWIKLPTEETAKKRKKLFGIF